MQSLSCFYSHMLRTYLDICSIINHRHCRSSPQCNLITQPDYCTSQTVPAPSANDTRSVRLLSTAVVGVCCDELYPNNPTADILHAPSTTSIGRSSFDHLTQYNIHNLPKTLHLLFHRPSQRRTSKTCRITNISRSPGPPCQYLGHSCRNVKSRRLGIQSCTQRCCRRIGALIPNQESASVILDSSHAALHLA